MALLIWSWQNDSSDRHSGAKKKNKNKKTAQWAEFCKKFQQESNKQQKKSQRENSQIEQQMLNIVLIYSGPAVLMAM